MLQILFLLGLSLHNKKCCDGFVYRIQHSNFLTFRIFNVLGFFYGKFSDSSIVVRFAFFWLGFFTAKSTVFSRLRRLQMPKRICPFLNTLLKERTAKVCRSWSAIVCGIVYSRKSTTDIITTFGITTVLSLMKSCRRRSL